MTTGLKSKTGAFASPRRPPYACATMPLTLAMADFSNPILWAIIIGWILSVTLHEFAHGFVAHLGGDYTIRERGGLSLNPLQYVDPFGSIILPVIFLLMGGIPLPGGMTYVRRDLLRNRAWEVAVSAAGPAMNFLIYLVLCLLLTPAVGWLKPGEQPTTAQLWVGAMIFLQLLATILNLLPIPPLDGFQMVFPFLPYEWKVRLSNPATVNICYMVFFFLLIGVPGFRDALFAAMIRVHIGLGFDPSVFILYFKALGRA